MFLYILPIISQEPIKIIGVGMIGNLHNIN